MSEILNPVVALAGLKFPATQVSSSDVNTLDDYEEGTWTPVLSFGGATTGITYSLQTGVYTKIGRLVFATLRIRLTSKGSASGSAIIAGLPFAAAFSYAGGVAYYENLAGVTAFTAYAGSGDTGVELMNGGAATLAAANDTNFTNTSWVYATIVFSVA
jgi:hypothetical protein